jgi:hypothetical protein
MKTAMLLVLGLEANSDSDPGAKGVGAEIGSEQAALKVLFETAVR